MQEVSCNWLSYLASGKRSFALPFHFFYKIYSMYVNVHIYSTNTTHVHYLVKRAAPFLCEQWLRWFFLYGVHFLVITKVQLVHMLNDRTILKPKVIRATLDKWTGAGNNAEVVWPFFKS